LLSVFLQRRGYFNAVSSRDPDISAWLSFAVTAARPVRSEHISLNTRMKPVAENNPIDREGDV